MRQLPSGGRDASLRAEVASAMLGGRDASLRALVASAMAMLGGRDESRRALVASADLAADLAAVRTMGTDT